MKPTRAIARTDVEDYAWRRREREEVGFEEADFETKDLGRCAYCHRQNSVVRRSERDSWICYSCINNFDNGEL